jgi:hypothetical protein
MTATAGRAKPPNPAGRFHHTTPSPRAVLHALPLRETPPQGQPHDRAAAL